MRKQNLFFTILESPANWCAMGVAALAFFLVFSGTIPLGGMLALALVFGAYVAGLAISVALFGAPWKRGDAQGATAKGDARERMQASLATIRRHVHLNPNKRLNKNLRGRVLTLCRQIDVLLEQWERNKSGLSLEERFDAHHIAVRHLPDALRTYCAIPKKFATTEALENGKTALETFEATLDDLGAKVAQLRDELMRDEAQGLLNHSSFVNGKFSGAVNPVPRGPAES